MGSWRDQILCEFTPQVARLTLVADPDGLLLEEGVMKGIRERGFELIPFDDHVEFRYAYESMFRSHWDRGGHTDLVVVLRSSLSHLNRLPFDLLQAGRKLSFNLGEIFPNLSYPVVDALDRSDLDALYDAQIRHSPENLGDNATKEFALRHVFEIAPELIKKPSDLLRVLLRKHYRGFRIPPVLDEHFIQILRHNGMFDDWPLDKIIPDREAFFAFLQERWPAFLDRWAASDISAGHEDKTSYGLEYSGPLDIPFDHKDVKVYIDNLFLEGMLKPVAHKKSTAFSKHWFAVGVCIDSSVDRLRRIEGLLRTIEKTLPSIDARHQDWLIFAYRRAELNVICIGENSSIPRPLQNRFLELRERIDSSFMEWLDSRYAGLYNQPPVPPVMVHHIPRAMAHRLSRLKKEKTALILIDGLALDQWIVLRNVLQSQRPMLRFREKSVFAWVPTLTSVSRQAAFSGREPLFFPSSIHNTDREAALWTQFWNDHGLSQKEIGYIKRIGDESISKIEDLLPHSRVRVVGLVIDKVDKIMHGMELGTPGMFNQIRQWGAQGFLARILDILLDQGFQISICSDHGNIEAKGFGKPAEGVVADIRGQRARIFPGSTLRSRVKERFPDSIEWPSIGLPDDFLPLLAPNRKAFIGEDERVVAHGGATLEELIVPFIHIERKDA